MNSLINLSSSNKEVSLEWEHLIGNIQHVSLIGEINHDKFI